MTARHWEGIVGFWHSGLSITALLEKKAAAFIEPGFNWFYGVGGHAAFYGDDFDGHGPAWYEYPHDKDDGDLGLGIDGIVTLEYKIQNVPIAFSPGLKTYIEITTDGGFFFSPDPGF